MTSCVRICFSTRILGPQRWLLVFRKAQFLDEWCGLQACPRICRVKNSLVVSSISSSIGSCRLAEVWFWVLLSPRTCWFYVRYYRLSYSKCIWMWYTVHIYIYLCSNVHVFEYVYKLYICMYSIISPNGCLWYVLIWFASSWGDPIRFQAAQGKDMQLMRCIGQGSPEVTWRG